MIGSNSTFLEKNGVLLLESDSINKLNKDGCQLEAAGLDVELVSSGTSSVGLTWISGMTSDVSVLLLMVVSLANM